MCATPIVTPASIAAPASANGELRANIIPAIIVDAAIVTIDSYALDQGACPEIYQRIPNPVR